MTSSTRLSRAAILRLGETGTMPKRDWATITASQSPVAARPQNRLTASAPRMSSRPITRMRADG